MGSAILRLTDDLWSALASSDVSALRRAATWDFSAWPLLRRAVTLQLQRLPPREGALSAVETETLALLREAPKNFGAFFRDLSMGQPGLLHDLAWGDTLLVEITPPVGKAPLLDQQFGAWQITMTGEGRAVLQGEQLRTSHPDQFSRCPVNLPDEALEDGRLVAQAFEGAGEAIGQPAEARKQQLASSMYLR